MFNWDFHPLKWQKKTQLAEFQNLILYLALLSSSDIFHLSLQVLMCTLSTAIFFPLLGFFLFHISLLQVPLVSLFFCFKLPLLGAAPFRWSFVAGYGARGPHCVTLLNIRFDLVVILDFFFGKMIFIYQIEWASNAVPQCFVSAYTASCMVNAPRLVVIIGGLLTYNHKTLTAHRGSKAN